MHGAAFQFASVTGLTYITTKDKIGSCKMGDLPEFLPLIPSVTVWLDFGRRLCLIMQLNFGCDVCQPEDLKHHFCSETVGCSSRTTWLHNALLEYAEPSSQLKQIIGQVTETLKSKNSLFSALLLKVILSL